MWVQFSELYSYEIWIFQPQAWGQGKKSKRNPKFLSEYHTAAIKFQAFDPRPVEMRETTKKEMNDFLTAVQGLTTHESNWEAIPPDYDDYEITDEKHFYFNKSETPNKHEESRKNVLKQECDLFVANLKASVEKYEMDPLSNSFAYHISGTEGQALIDLWHLIRLYRVTASKFKVIKIKQKRFKKITWI